MENDYLESDLLNIFHLLTEPHMPWLLHLALHPQFLLCKVIPK